jgi:intracellular multiplication protein IcmV
MAIFSSKQVAGRLVDVRVDRWMSWDYISETTERLKNNLTDIVIPKKATYSETFDEAMLRMDLTEEDLAQRKKEFTRLLYYFLGIAFVIIAYALFMAFKGSMITSLIAFCLSMYALTQAFRFHFWLFQLKNRKLGCTIKEWINSAVLDEKSSQAIVPVQDNTQMTTKNMKDEKDKSE